CHAFSCHGVLTSLVLCLVQHVFRCGVGRLIEKLDLDEFEVFGGIRVLVSERIGRLGRCLHVHDFAVFMTINDIADFISHGSVPCVWVGVDSRTPASACIWSCAPWISSAVAENASISAGILEKFRRRSDDFAWSNIPVMVSVLL